MRKRMVLFVALLAACGKSKSDDKQPANAPAPASAGPDRVSNHTLATTPLQNVAQKAGGVAFTIELPLAELKEPDVEGAYATWEPKKAWTDTPDFTVQFSDMPMSPDSTGDTEPIGDDAKDRVIARAEKLEGGGYLNLDERKDKAFFRLEVCKPAPTGSLCCTVIQRSDKPLEAFDEIVGLAEKVCRSLKAS